MLTDPRVVSGADSPRSGARVTMRTDITQAHRMNNRIKGIAPFHVMDILARARALEAKGRSIVHLEIGEPDFPTPKPILDAGMRALAEHKTFYTPALGLDALREAIAQHYADAAIEPARIAVTPGATGALLLALSLTLEAGDEVLMTDPGYPCNRHLAHLLGGIARPIPVDAATHFQLSAERIRREWGPRTRAVLLASPANPTGTLMADDELREVVRVVRGLGGVVIVDEIYRGLTYGAVPPSAARYADAGNVYVVNSFSKYFGMTGWRLGWLLAPKTVSEAMDRVAQNIFLAPSTPAQYAALAAFEADTLAELERRRALLDERRRFMLSALRDIGFALPAEPQGAFYIYAESSRFRDDSLRFVRELLDKTGVAITPGCDFGSHRAERFVRFSYANDMAVLQDGMQRLGAFLRG